MQSKSATQGVASRRLDDDLDVSRPAVRSTVRQKGLAPEALVADLDPVYTTRVQRPRNFEGLTGQVHAGICEAVSFRKPFVTFGRPHIPASSNQDAQN